MTQQEDERSTSKSKSKSKVGRVGEGEESSLLETFGISSWTPPWATTKVAVQQPTSRVEPTGQETVADSRKTLDENCEEPSLRANLKGNEKHPAEAGSSAQQESEEAEAGRGRGSGTREGPEKVKPRLCVLDARTAVAALGNKLIGKGIERGEG